IWLNIAGFGLGGVGPFLDYSTNHPHTFDPSSHALADAPSCVFSDAAAILPSDVRACADHFNPGSAQNGPTTISVYSSTGSRSTVDTSSIDGDLGAFRPSLDATKLAFGVWSGGDFSTGAGSYGTRIVDVQSGRRVSVDGVVPAAWLPDGRLVVTDKYRDGASSILSASGGGAPARITSDTVVGVLAG
ncbi:MAG: hypothetical protein ABR498_05760, partial [Candidatus Dormibacteria bacterium]